jgi:hypothetical protein
MRGWGCGDVLFGFGDLAEAGALAAGFVIVVYVFLVPELISDRHFNVLLLQQVFDHRRMRPQTVPKGTPF